MRLDSVQGLKAELLNDLVAPIEAHSASPLKLGKSLAVAFGVPRAGAVRSFNGMAARPITSVPDLQRSLALGVAPTAKNEYRLAIRLQRAALRNSAIVEHLKHKARGEVDIRMVGRIEKRAKAAAALWYQANNRPLLIGCSVGHFKVTAGTLGAFVTRDDGKIYILSNNHVLANENKAARGDAVWQRAHLDGGSSADKVARLSHSIALRKSGANLIDASLAEVGSGFKHNPSLLRGLIKGANRQLNGLGPEFIDEGETVYKVGRTTGPTKGKVTAFDLDNVVVSYGIGNLRFDGQIEIEGVGKDAFSDGGDSGSLIVNGKMQAVALLFAGSDIGGSNGAGLTFANPIHPVLKKLRATLLP